MTSDDIAPSNAANEAINPSLVTRPSSSRLARVTGLVLAGGMGRRMDSRDKGLVPFRGKPMVAHVIERLAPQVGSVLINANRNSEQYEAFGYPVISDEVGGFAGPLAGLHAGMRACTTELIVTAPCDSPFLPLDLVARLPPRRAIHRSCRSTLSPGCMLRWRAKSPTSPSSAPAASRSHRRLRAAGLRPLQHLAAAKPYHLSGERRPQD